MAALCNKDTKKTKKWREKALYRSHENKLLRMEIKRLQTSRLCWKAKFTLLKSTTKKKFVARHSYPLELMWLAIIMHSCYNVSLRSTAKTIQKVAVLSGIKMKEISANTVRNWSLRLGLYYLTQPISAGRYALIADESIAIGRERLLAIIAIKIDDQSRIAPLEMSDIRVLHLQSKSSWGGEEIAEIIKTKTTENGMKVSYMISDKGTNLIKCCRLNGLERVDDCTHLVANCTKKLYKNDQILNDFVKNMNKTRAKWSLSTNVLYIPPALREKGRFHQILIIHEWAENILKQWTDLPISVTQELTYVWDNQSLIEELKAIHQLIDVFFSIFKSTGVNENSEKIWKEKYDANYAKIIESETTQHLKIKQYLNSMNQFVAQIRSRFPHNEQVICCSDIIESIFGKYKNKNGLEMITDDALKIATYEHDISQTDVQQALIHKNMAALLDWKSKNTTVSLLALKRRATLKNASKIAA
jgi:hypothetical protein